LGAGLEVKTLGLYLRGGLVWGLSLGVGGGSGFKGRGLRVKGLRFEFEKV